MKFEEDGVEYYVAYTFYPYTGEGVAFATSVGEVSLSGAIGIDWVTRDGRPVHCLEAGLKGRMQAAAVLEEGRLQRSYVDGSWARAQREASKRR